MKRTATANFTHNLKCFYVAKLLVITIFEYSFKCTSKYVKRLFGIIKKEPS